MLFLPIVLIATQASKLYSFLLSLARYSAVDRTQLLVAVVKNIAVALHQILFYRPADESARVRLIHVGFAHPQKNTQHRKRYITKKKVNATPPWRPFEHPDFLYFQVFILSTRTRIINELNFFQTRRNETRRIRVEAHRSFLSKRPLTLKMDLVPQFFQLQFHLHLKSALDFVYFRVKKITYRNTTVNCP